MPITHAQAGKLHDQLIGHQRYMKRVRERLEAVGYTPRDPLYLAAMRAENAVHALAVAAHYASCTSGVCNSGEGTAAGQE